MVIILWAHFAAPNSKKRLKNPYRMIFKLSLFALSALFLLDLGEVVWFAVYTLVLILNVTLALIFRQDF
jgi:hypothetical protein